MATLAAVRVAVAARLATISGLRTYAHWPGQINLPCALIIPKQLQYLETMGRSELSLHRMQFDVLILVETVSRASARGDERLSAYVDYEGAQSIAQAINDDPTLGGVVTTSMIDDLGDYGVMEVGNVDYWGARLTLSVVP